MIHSMKFNLIPNPGP